MENTMTKQKMTFASTLALIAGIALGGCSGKTSHEKGKESETVVEEKITRTETETKSRDLPGIEEVKIKADINRMKAEDFMALGLPKESAENIIDYREEQGSFRSVDELKQVPGLDHAWVDQNRTKLGVIPPKMSSSSR